MVEGGGVVTGNMPSLTCYHKGEVKPLLHGLPVHLVRESGKAHILLILRGEREEGRGRYEREGGGERGKISERRRWSELHSFRASSSVGFSLHLSKAQHAEYNGIQTDTNKSVIQQGDSRAYRQVKA